MGNDNVELLLCSIKEGRKTLDVGHTKFYQLINAGKIKTVHIGSHHKVVVESLKEYVRSLSMEAGNV